MFLRVESSKALLNTSKERVCFTQNDNLVVLSLNCRVAIESPSIKARGRITEKISGLDPFLFLLPHFLASLLPTRQKLCNA